MSGHRIVKIQPTTGKTSWSSLLGMEPRRTPSAADAIRIEQLAFLIRQTPKMTAASAAAALTVAAVMWPLAPPAFIAVWAGLIAVVTAMRLPGWWRNRHRPRPKQASARSIHRAVWYGGLLGLLWGMGIAVLVPPQAPAYEMFLLVAFTGIAAGGILALAVVPLAAMVYALGATIPVMIRLLMIGTPLQFAFCVFAVLFIVCMLLIAREAYRSFTENVLMRVANQSLTDELEAARTDLTDAIEALDHGVAHYDADGRLLLCNDSFRAMFPQQPDKVRPGVPFGELIDLMLPSSVVDGRVMAPQAWRQWRLEHFQATAGVFEHCKPNGRWYRSYDMRTRRGGILSVHIDITELKARESAQEQAKAEAESASEAKSRFLALMSHELRTPLNAIIGFAELLESEALGPHSNPRYCEYANSIHSAGGHLLKVINDILDLSKVEAGRMELQEQDVHLPSLVEDVVRLMGETARRAGVDLSSDLTHAPALLVADLRAVRQMLINLVSNAIKFTETGGSVRIGVRADSDGLVIAVRDTGIGIAPQDIPVILEPFGQARGTGHSHQQGTGLGLPLVQSLIELHGGRLLIESTPGEGTTAVLQFGAERLLAPAAAQ